MIDLIPSITESLLDKIQGVISPEAIMELKQKENATLAMCGGLLGIATY